MKTLRLFSVAVIAFSFSSIGALADDFEVETAQQSRTIEFQSPIIARQGDALVTAADLDVYVGRIPEEDRASFLRSRLRLGGALENLMLPRLIANEADANGFSNRTDIVSKVYQSAVVLIAQEYMEYLFESQALDNYEQKARELFITEPELFRSPERVSFTHVLIQSGQERGELDAMRSIFNVYERLSDGASVEEMAVEYSDDPAVEDNNGRYEAVDKASLDPVVATALSVMEPGQISEPVRSNFGWHVIRLDDNIERENLEWELAQAQAIELARSRHRELVLERFVHRLRNDVMETDIPAIQAYLDGRGIDWTLMEFQEKN